MFDKFNHISDELLAAYLDGNTTIEETGLVLEAMTFDDIREAVQLFSSWEDEMSVYSGDFGFLEIDINPVLYDNTESIITSVDINDNNLSGNDPASELFNEEDDISDDNGLFN